MNMKTLGICFTLCCTNFHALAAGIYSNCREAIYCLLMNLSSEDSFLNSKHFFLFNDKLHTFSSSQSDGKGRHVAFLMDIIFFVWLRLPLVTARPISARNNFIGKKSLVHYFRHATELHGFIQEYELWFGFFN